MMLLWWAMAIHAAPPIEWTAPEPCPTAEQVKEKLADVLGDGAPVQAEIEATGHVSQADGRFRLQLELRSPTGSRSRSLEAASCEELTNVAVLLIAVAVDPGIAARLPALAEQLAAPVPIAPEAADPAEEAAGALPEPAPAEVELEVPAEAVPPEPAVALPEPVVAEPPASPSKPVATPPSRATAPASQPARAHRRTAGFLSVATGVHIGTLPTPTPTARLGLGLTWRALRVELGATHRFESSSGRVRDVRVAVSSTIGDIALCGVPRTGSIEFPFCLGVEAGVISGRTRSAIAPAHGRAPWVAARGGAGLVVKPWSRFGFTVDIDAVVPLIRTEFEVVGLGELFRTPPAGADIMIGTLLRFP